MKNPIIKSMLIIIFGFLFLSQTSISAEKNLQKCREFSSIGLHLPAIEQCQKAMRDGVNREAELELLYYLANSYSSINKNMLAKEAITKLLNTSPSISANDYYLAGLIEIKLNNNKEAIFYLEKAILGEPNSISIKRQLARALFQTGDTRKANLILTGNFYEDSSDTQSMTQLSENLISEGNLIKANLITNRIIEINPGYSYAYYLKYIISIKEDDLQNALANINKAIMRDRENIRYLIEKVKLLITNKKYDLAKYNLTIIEQLSPNTPGIPNLYENILDLQATDLHSYAREMIKQKDYESAINYYNKAINLNPSDAILYFERGQLLSKMKNYKNAENDLIIASSLNENLVASNVNLMLGKIYYQLGERDKSIAFIDKELTINANNKEALLWQIRSYSEAGEYDFAEDYAEKLIEVDPVSPDGYSILGDIKLMKGDIQESNELHNKVIELDPNYNIATRKKSE